MTSIQVNETNSLLVVSCLSLSLRRTGFGCVRPSWFTRTALLSIHALLCLTHIAHTHTQTSYLGSFRVMQKLERGGGSAFRPRFFFFLTQQPHTNLSDHHYHHPNSTPIYATVGGSTNMRVVRQSSETATRQIDLLPLF